MTRLTATQNDISAFSVVDSISQPHHLISSVISAAYVRADNSSYTSSYI